MLIIGYLLSKCIFPGPITWEKELSPLHALSIVSSILIAVIISMFFNTRQDKVKIKKTFYNERINKLEKYLLEYSKLFENSEIIESRINFLNKKIGMFRTELETLKNIPTFINKESIAICLESIKENHDKLRKLTTEDSI